MPHSIVALKNKQGGWTFGEHRLKMGGGPSALKNKQVGGGWTLGQHRVEGKRVTFAGKNLITTGKRMTSAGKYLGRI